MIRDIATRFINAVFVTVAAGFAGVMAIYLNGRTCVGFVVEPRDVMAVGAALVATMARNVDPDDLDDVLDDAVELTRRGCVDSMGLGAIVYFPGVTATD